MTNEISPWQIFNRRSCMCSQNVPSSKLTPLQFRQIRPRSNYFAKNRSYIVYGDEWAIFAPVRVFHFSKFRTETITLVENSICFLQSTPVPLGSTCESLSCMSSLFHWEFSSSFSSSQREREEGWRHSNTKTNLFVSKEKL